MSNEVPGVLSSRDRRGGTGVMGGLVGRYRPWELAESISRPGFRSVEAVRLGVRRLYGAYPEYKAQQGPHREF